MRREMVLGWMARAVLIGVSPEEDEKRKKRLLTWMPTYDTAATKRVNNLLRRTLSPRR